MCTYFTFFIWANFINAKLCFTCVLFVIVNNALGVSNHLRNKQCSVGTIHIHHHVIKENNKDREFVVTQIYKTKL